MDKRKAERKVVKSKFEGGVVFIEFASLHDISLTGVRFMSFKELPLYSEQNMVVRHDDGDLHLRGTVLRCTPTDIGKVDGHELHVFEIALAFDSMEPEKTDALRDLLENL